MCKDGEIHLIIHVWIIIWEVLANNTLFVCNRHFKFIIILFPSIEWLTIMEININIHEFQLRHISRTFDNIYISGETNIVTDAKTTPTISQQVHQHLIIIKAQIHHKWKYEIIFTNFVIVIIIFFYKSTIIRIYNTSSRLSCSAISWYIMYERFWCKLTRA